MHNKHVWSQEDFGRTWKYKQWSGKIEELDKRRGER